MKGRWKFRVLENNYLYLAYRVMPFFACPDTYTPFQVQDHDLSIPDLACFGPFDDRFNGRVNKVLINGDFKTDFLQQIHFVNNASLGFTEPFLLPAT